MSASTARYTLVASILLTLVTDTASVASAQEGARRPQESQYRIAIFPRRAVIDQPVQITVQGLQAGEEVTLDAELQNHLGSDWQSSATFRADSQGNVDLSRLAPVAGSYDSVDPMGLFWSMHRVARAEPAESPGVRPGEPLIMTLAATAPDRPVLSDTLHRLFADTNVIRRPVRESGLVGTLFSPLAGAPRPALLVLGGSSCSSPEALAALLATHGFVALGLQYCGAEGQPRTIGGEFPLEYFETALNWLKGQKEVVATSMGVLGLSFGGELALLLGSRFHDIRAVVSIKGSGVIVGHNFTFSGERVPSTRMQGTETLRAEVRSRQPPGCRPRSPEDEWSCFDWTSVRLNFLLFHALMNPDSLGPGVIPVERSNGPVLLVSGFGDLAWPSTLFSEVAFKRLEAHDFPFPFEHLAYPGAGHRLGAPHLPRTDDRFGTILMGGNAKDAAAANADYWPRMVQFLREHLGTGVID